jgi:integrase/recombinase XerD
MEEYLTDPRMLKELRQGLFGPFLDEFVSQLVDQRYASDSIRTRLGIVRAFARWLKRGRVARGQITQEHVSHYMQCRFRRQPWARSIGIRRALTRLVDILRERGGLKGSIVRVRRNSIREVIDQFAQYLKQQRNLSDSTIARRRMILRAFLSERFAGGKVRLSRLQPKDVLNFARKYASAYPRSASAATSALRSFFKYLRYEGKVEVNLEDAVPFVARWSLASLPKAISPKHVRKVLSDCDRRTHTGKRDFAILLMLARLGMRACEVRGLKLEDIDWEHARITIHGKDGRPRELPLLRDVGNAIVEYIRYARPNAKCRNVFLRSRAPVGPLNAPSSVGALVGRALARSGIETGRNGAHQFRHGLASEMLRKGASLFEIGEVLGHRNPDTTAIYAKVDLVALRTIALPWPGGAK